MKFPCPAFVRPIAAACFVALSAAALAQGARVGDIRIDHPYARPSLAGSANGGAYLASLENTGDKPDRLVRASTPVAASVQLHTMGMDAQGVMRMREVEAIALAPKGSIAMRPGQGFHLMLMGLREPLKEGAKFPMSLTFERAGKVDVEVVVETPRAASAPAAPHTH
ncbi:MAG: copper chaperone PCu(A)C [Caldimonas sp.]